MYSRNELSTPPLRKTINETEDVRCHLFEDEDQLRQNELLEQSSRIKRPESGILPPVVPYKSFSSKNFNTPPDTAERASPKRLSASGDKTSSQPQPRKSILQRSKTINGPESSNRSSANGILEENGHNGVAPNLYHQEQVGLYLV